MERNAALSLVPRLYARASAAWDFYRSNDPRFTGNGPRLRLVAGYRF